jgi:hypothetical protein
LLLLGACASTSQTQEASTTSSNGSVTSTPSATSSTGSTGSTGSSTHGSSVSSSSSTVATSGATTTGAEGGTGCAALPLCDDFESDTAGSAPNPSLWGIIDQGGCSGQSTFSVTVDGTHAHSGANAVKVVGGDSCGPLMINSSAFTSLSSGEVYGRFYTWFSTDAGWGHAVFAALGFEPDAGPLGNASKEYLQIAALTDGTTPIMEWNYSDLELPQRNGMEVATNVYPGASAWTCIEFHTSSSAGSVEVWVNGVADANMTFVPGTTAVTSLNTPWSTGKPALAMKSVGFGWINFDGGATNTLWFDDIALGASRIGCD